VLTREAGLGLGLTLAGAIPLFFFAIPKRSWPDYLLRGHLLLKTDDSLSDEQVKVTKSRAACFLKWSATANATGFGLVALGTLLQSWALFLDE